MANFLDKIKIRTANSRPNKFDLSCDHITTQDFFALRPVYSRELIPKQSINVKHSLFTRLAPLYKPMFGSVRQVQRAFFVPFRTVFPYFNDFIEDTVSHVNGATRKYEFVPYTTINDFRVLFSTAANGYAAVTQDSTAYDFSYNGDLYRLTRKGCSLMTILNSLGYSISFSNSYDTNVSLLPFMCFAKVIADWYCNSQYQTRRNAIENALSNFTAGTGVIQANQLNTLCDSLVYSLYDSDYFTSSMDNPVMPNDSVSSGVTIPDVTNDGPGSNYRSVVSNASQPSNGVPSTPSIKGVNTSGVVSPTATTSNISQYLVDALKSLTDFAKRHQLVGAQTLDRYLADHGVALSVDKLNRSTYLGKSENIIQISDVMATATGSESTGSDTNISLLGDYAGKGVGYDQGGEFSYKADEFGMMIIVSTILPKVGYVQGLNRRNVHIDRLDFFNGDFDALGPQAVARFELYNDAHTTAQVTSLGSASYDPNGIFGYQPRYAEYCVANDLLSGSFRFNSQNEGLDAWHLFRLFDPSTVAKYQDIMHHDEDFCVGDGSQYLRIFNYLGDDVDHFFAIHHFDVKSTMPKKPLYEQYDFDGGEQMLVNLGGTRLN